jgi:hypothetical protein
MASDSGRVLRWNQSAPVRALDLAVVSGKGIAGRKGRPRRGQEEQIFLLTGIRRLPGSLNLRSSSPIWFVRRRAITCGELGLYPGRLAGMDVIVVKRGAVGAQPRLLHIYSNLHLRTELGLRDGDRVTLYVPKQAVGRGIFQRSAYAARLIRRRITSMLPITSLLSRGERGLQRM